MSDEVSAWAAGRFGAAAGEVRRRVVRAVVDAHDSAAAAQAVSKTNKRDPYGHTMKNTQHERLVEELRDLPGVEIRPSGASYELARLPHRQVTLYPLRYANDGNTPREKAKIRLSTIRMDLLGPAHQADPEQLTIDHAELTQEEIQDEFGARAEIERQLGSLSCVVIIGYASSPGGIHDLGWGEGSLGHDGHLRWVFWESLPLPGSSTGDGFGDVGDQIPVSPNPWPGSSTVAEQGPSRFDDDVDGDDDLDIVARRSKSRAPQQEKGPASEQTSAAENKS